MRKETSVMQLAAVPARQPAAVVRLPVASSDEVLVGAVLRGDDSAVAQLFERHAGYVRHIVARVLGPDPDLEDLVQDAFLAALASLKRLDDPARLRGYLTSIAVFTARAHIRKRRRWRHLLSFVADPPEPPASVVPADARQALGATYRVLERLSVDERIAFALRYVEGMLLTEVAETLGVSLATAKRRLASATARFTTLAWEEPALHSWLEEGARWTR